MEKSSKKIDRITQEIVRTGGLHKPSPDFKANVMEAVSRIESKKISYAPLIPKKIWVVLSLVFSAFIVYLILFPNTDFHLLEGMNILDKLAVFNLSFPEMKLSKEMLYGIGFLGLFLLQIPLLKRQLDRIQY